MGCEQGLWQYRRDLPRDLDTSSLYILILEKAGRLSNRNLANYLTTLRNHRDRSGAFYTWVNVPKHNNEIDAGVNINISFLLREMGAVDSKLEQALTESTTLYYSDDFVKALRGRTNSNSCIEFEAGTKIFCDKNTAGDKIWIHSPFVERCIQIHNKTTELCLKITRRRREDQRSKLHRTITKRFTSELTTISAQYPTQASVLEKFLRLLPKLEKGHGIICTRTELYMKKSLSHPIDACLGALYGWTAFTLIDDLVDSNEEQTRKPPLSPYLLIHLINKSIEHFSSTGIPHNEISHAISVSSLFSHLDADKKIHSYLELINVAWKKSFAQTIGLFHTSFWKRYTLIKQLNDDLHDILEDIQHTKQTLPSIVYSFLLQNTSQTERDRSLYMTIRYFSKVIARLCADSLTNYYNLPIETRATFWRREIERTAINARRAPIEFIKLLHLRKEIEKHSRIN